MSLFSSKIASSALPPQNCNPANMAPSTSLTLSPPPNTSMLTAGQKEKKRFADSEACSSNSPDTHSAIRKRLQPNNHQDDKSKQKATKKVSFLPMAYVILIPTSEEYHHAGLAPSLWWNEQDYKSFKRGALTDLQVFLNLHPYLDPKLAVKKYFYYVEDGIPTSSSPLPQSPPPQPAMRVNQSPSDANASCKKDLEGYDMKNITSLQHKSGEGIQDDEEFPSLESKAHIPVYHPQTDMRSPTLSPSTSNLCFSNGNPLASTEENAVLRFNHSSSGDDRPPVGCRVFENNTESDGRCQDMKGIISKVSSMMLGSMLHDD